VAELCLCRWPRVGTALARPRWQSGKGKKRKFDSVASMAARPPFLPTRRSSRVRQQRKGWRAEVEGLDHEAAAEVSEVGGPPPCFVIGSNQAVARSGSGEGRGRSPLAGSALVRCGRAGLDGAYVQLGGHDCGRRASTTTLCHSGVKGEERKGAGREDRKQLM
jgi:hypothetical protein